MAELPRYQMMGIPVPGMPQLDFAAQQERARLAGGLSESLNRISQFAFKEATKEAEIKGMQYGAENPVTKEQISEAMKEGRSPQELLQERGTAFGDTARAVQVAQLRNELEVSARNDFATISAGIEANKYTNINDVKSTIDGITEGYANVIRGLDPVAAIRFRQSVTVAGNAVYAKAADRVAKLNTAAIKDSAGVALQATTSIISDTFAVEQDQDNVMARVALERKRVADIALQVGDPAFYTSTMKEFDKKLIKSMSDQLIKSGLKPADALMAIDKGNVGNMSSLLKNRVVDKELLQKAYLSDLGEQVQVMERTKKLEEDKRKDEGLSIRMDLYSGRITGNVAIAQLRAIGDISREELKSIMKGEATGPKGSDELIGKLESLADNGQIGESSLDSMANSGRISWKQANELKRKVRNNNTDMSRANGYINSSLGVPDPLTPGFNTERQRSAQARAELARRENEARNQGLAFDAFAVANEIIKKTKDTESYKVQQEAKGNLRKILDGSGIKYNEDYTDANLKDLNVKDPSVRRKILRLSKDARGE